MITIAGFSLNRIMQKLTSPDFDQDTDSLEALRDEIDTIPKATTGLVYKVSQPNANGAAIIGDTVSWSYGAWVEFLSAAQVDEDIWVCGLMGIITANVNRHDMQIGKGDSGSESVIATIFRKDWDDSSDLIFPVPIKVVSGMRVAGRVAQFGATAITVMTKLLYCTGLQ